MCCHQAFTLDCNDLERYDRDDSSCDDDSGLMMVKVVIGDSWGGVIVMTVKVVIGNGAILVVIMLKVAIGVVVMMVKVVIGYGWGGVVLVVMMIKVVIGDSWGCGDDGKGGNW